MQDIDRRSRDLGKLDQVLEFLGVGVLAGLLLGFIPLPLDGVLDAGREGVFPVIAVIAGVIAVGIDLPSRSRRLFAIFTAVAAAHVAWTIQGMARTAVGDPSPVAHGAVAVVLTVLYLMTLATGFVAFCGAMIGASKYFDAAGPQTEWKATMRFGGRASLVLVGAGLIGSIGQVLGVGAVVTGSVIAAVVTALAVFIRVLSAGAATRRWISEALSAS